MVAIKDAFKSIVQPRDPSCDQYMFCINDQSPLVQKGVLGLLVAPGENLTLTHNFNGKILPVFEVWQEAKAT